MATSQHGAGRSKDAKGANQPQDNKNSNSTVDWDERL